MKQVLKIRNKPLYQTVLSYHTKQLFRYKIFFSTDLLWGDKENPHTTCPVDFSNWSVRQKLVGEETPSLRCEGLMISISTHFLDGKRPHWLVTTGPCDIKKENSRLLLCSHGESLLKWHLDLCWLWFLQKLMSFFPTFQVLQGGPEEFQTDNSGPH